MEKRGHLIFFLQESLVGIFCLQYNIIKVAQPQVTPNFLINMKALMRSIKAFSIKLESTRRKT